MKVQTVELHRNEVRIAIRNLEATSVTETDTTGWRDGKEESMQKQIKTRELSQCLYLIPELMKSHWIDYKQKKGGITILPVFKRRGTLSRRGSSMDGNNHEMITTWESCAQWRLLRQNLVDDIQDNFIQVIKSAWFVDGLCLGRGMNRRWFQDLCLGNVQVSMLLFTDIKYQKVWGWD